MLLSRWNEKAFYLQVYGIQNNLLKQAFRKQGESAVVYSEAYHNTKEKKNQPPPQKPPKSNKPKETQDRILVFFFLKKWRRHCCFFKDAAHLSQIYINIFQLMLT